MSDITKTHVPICPVCGGPGKIQFTQGKGKPYIGCEEHDEHNIEALMIHMHRGWARRGGTLRGIKKGTLRWLFNMMVPMSFVASVTYLSGATTKGTWIAWGVISVLMWVLVMVCEVAYERKG